MIENTLRDAVLSERISETSYREMSAYLEKQKEAAPRHISGAEAWDMLKETFTKMLINYQKSNIPITDENVDAELDMFYPIMEKAVLSIITMPGDDESIMREFYHRGYEDGKQSERKKQKEPIPSTEEAELNSIAFLEQLGYTCIPPKNDEYESYEDGNVTGLRRKEQKPAEWSEKDEKIKHDIESLIHFALKKDSAVSPGANTTKEEALNWLKFLRPQPKSSEDELEKEYWRGYKDAMEQYNKNVSFHQDYPTSPSIPRSCYEGGPCTNPFHDCVNCPRVGRGGAYITQPNTATSVDSNNLEAHWKPSEEQMEALF